MSETTREIAQKIVNHLFVNGAGQIADRLILIQEDYPGKARVTSAKDLGGWSRLPLIDFIESAIRGVNSNAD